MSDNIVRAIVETRIQDNWALTEIAWDNAEYHEKKGTPFIRTTITETDCLRKGARCYKRTYSVIIQLFVPKKTGTATINSYAKTLKDLFEGYAEGNFFCLKGTSMRVPSSNQWYKKNVVLTCKYTEYK